MFFFLLRSVAVLFFLLGVFVSVLFVFVALRFNSHTTSIIPPTPTTMSSDDINANNEGDFGKDLARQINGALILKEENCDAFPCSVCGAVKSTDESKYKSCTCKLVSYCSKTCQRKDWADHKARCKKA